MMELLVTIGVAGVALTSAVQFFMTHARQLRQHSFRMEMQQGMRSSLDAITRDVRLAGACLPEDGNFVSLDGIDDAAGDEITVRTGAVNANLTCVRGSLLANAAAGATSVSIDDVQGFSADQLAYVSGQGGAVGETHRITGVVADGSGTGGLGGVVTFSGGLADAYAMPASVFAVDERRYSLDRSNPDEPLLMLQVNQGAAEAFAVGVSDLQFRYVLDRNCLPCDIVDDPGDNATWRLVNEVLVTARVETVDEVRTGDYAAMTATSRAKPRNLLP